MDKHNNSNNELSARGFYSLVWYTAPKTILLSPLKMIREKNVTIQTKGRFQEGSIGFFVIKHLKLSCSHPSKWSQRKFN